VRVEAADLKCADAVADVVRRVVVRRVVVRRGAEQCAEHPLCRLERLFTTAASRPSLLLVEQLQERADVLAGVCDELGVGVGLPAHLRRPVSPGEERTGRPDQPDVAARGPRSPPVPAPAPAPDRSRLRAWHAQRSRRHPVRRSTSTPPRRCSLNPSNDGVPAVGASPGLPACLRGGVVLSATNLASADARAVLAVAATLRSPRRYRRRGSRRRCAEGIGSAARDGRGQPIKMAAAGASDTA